MKNVELILSLKQIDDVEDALVHFIDYLKMATRKKRKGRSMLIGRMTRYISKLNGMRGKYENN